MGRLFRVSGQTLSFRNNAGPDNGEITCEVFDDAGTLVPRCPDNGVAWCSPSTRGIVYRTMEHPFSGTSCVARGEPVDCGEAWVCPRNHTPTCAPEGTELLIEGYPCIED